ncbi:MAG TPA: DUF177 domain-containing protein [Pyrinomonadaceae bacterium]|nr:DUF177 domain-containing protein [Pyrinomonadaceae bacterium]
MKVEVEKLAPEGEWLAHTYPEDALALDEEQVRLAGETHVRARASRKGDEVRLAGEITATVEAQCDLCLRAFQVPLELRFETAFTPSELENERAEHMELLGEDLDTSVYEDGEIDFDEVVREQILLGLPTRLRCREDCKGLCPTCGADLNTSECGCRTEEIDPRWAALASLKEREKQ